MLSQGFKAKLCSVVSILIFLLTLSSTTFAETSFNYNNYNYSDYLIPYSNTKLLAKTDLYELDRRMLDLARNEIFARHGYEFKDKQFQEYFKSKNWYKANTKFKVSDLSDIEKKNALFIKNYSNLINKNIDTFVCNKTDSKNLYTFVSSKAAMDINSDSRKENITITFNSNYTPTRYEINVNNASLEGSGATIIPMLYIVDINKSDKYKQIAVVDAGPSDDFTTTFYYFDGKEIKNIGTISGDIRGMYLEGNGIIHTKTRGKILQTWFYTDEYKLTNNHTLVNLPKKLYKMKTNITLLTNFYALKDKNEKSIKVAFHKGDKAVILESDNEKWCKIIDSNGNTGWFSVSRFNIINEGGVDANTVFDGLSNAD